MTDAAGPGSNVTRLVDRAQGIPAPDLREWLGTYLKAESLDPGTVKSVVLLVERQDGSIRYASQSVAPLDGFRFVGLLQHAIHRMLHGNVGGDL